MDIKKIFKDQKDGFKTTLKDLSYDKAVFTTFIVSWITLLAIMIVINGFLLGFVKAVLTSTVVCILSYNIAQFFKGDE